jgi:alpha-amylase
MKKFLRRMSGIVLAIVMAFTMLPSLPTVAAAAGSFDKQTITMHFKPASQWDKVYTYIKQGKNWDTIPEYSYIGDWPGAEIEKDSQNDGWYSFTIIMSKNELHCKFTNNKGIETKNDVGFTPDKEITEKWVTMSSNDQDAVVSDTKPSGWVDSVSNPPVKPVVKGESPKLNADKTVTFNLDATGDYKDETDVRLMGTVPGTNWDDGLQMEKKGDFFTVTTGKLEPGIYQYKFLIDKNGKNSWITDPANSEIKDGNSKLVVPGLESKTLTVTEGAALELPDKLNLYKADGTEEQVSVTYKLKDKNDKVTLKDNSLEVAKKSGIKEVKLVATAGSETSEITAKVVAEQYTYNIYFYDSNAAHMDVNAADVHMWEIGGPDIEPASFTEKVKLDDGNEWLKASITTDLKNIGMIPRSKGGWSWQTDNHTFNNADAKKSVDLYIVYGDKNTYTELPAIKEQRERKVIVEYERQNNDYDGWNIYSWNSGFGKETEIYTQEINGKHYIIVPVKDSEADMNLGFCVRRSGKAEADKWLEKDGGDHSIFVPANQTIVKAKLVQGKGVTEVLPYNKGYEMKGNEDKISFYYRDDSLMTADNEKSLDGKVKVVINGTAHDMSYNAKTERYEYDVNGCKSGEYTYYYIVNGKDVLDAFNTNSKKVDGKDVSYFTYKTFDDLGIKASLSNSKMSYNENNVLSVEFDGADKDAIKKAEVSSITADVSALGLDTLSIEPKLMKGTISVTDKTALGTKNIPVVVTDIYGNIYKTSTQVEVTKNNSSSFDWDEAVIYMTCTDRFYDGNTSNDKAYNTTDVFDKKGSLSYHGGDFAGLEQKLDYLENLGVNTIWITPIVENSDTKTDDNGKEIPSTGYHGYWASDFTNLNPHLGTEAEFKSLINAVHARGMKLMVDVVLNHAGYGTEDHFNSILKDTNGNTVKMLRDDSNTVTGDDVYDALSKLPDFVTENEDVMNQLVEWQTDWVKKYDIDYYRVDTVKHVNSETWAAFKNALTEADAEFKMIGEYSGAGYGNTAGELGTGRMDSLLDFDYNDQAVNFVSGNVEGAESFLESRNNSINNTATLGAFLSSHDEDSLVDKLTKEKGMTEEQALNAAKVAAALQLTSKGQTVIYYGEELGQHGLNNYPIQSNRYDFDWDALESQKTDASSMYNHYKKLLSIRNDYSALLSKGTRKNIATSNDEGYSVFERAYDGNALTVALNVKDAAKTVTIPVSLAAGTEVKDLYSGATYTVGSDKAVTVTIPAAKDGGTVILAEVKKTVDPTPADPGKKDPTPTPVKKDGVISVTDKAAIKTKKAAPKSGDDNEAATYVCLLGLAMVAITAATYRKKRACK